MGLPKEPGVVYHITVGVGHEVLKPHVYPDGKIGVGQFPLCLYLAGKDYIPAISLSLDGAGLDLALHRSMLQDADVSNLGKDDFPIFNPDRWFLLELLNLRIAEAVVAIISLKARI